MNAARELGFRIPGDLAVVGFDNIPLSAYFDPPLTTVEIPMYEAGADLCLIKPLQCEHFRLEVLRLLNESGRSEAAAV